MKLLHADLVEEYYQVVKRVYPEITKGQCNEICSAPFIQTRRAIESGIFINVRLQFFGTFVSYPKKLGYHLKLYTKMFKEQKMTPSNYFKTKELLESAIKRKEKENESKNKF